MEKDKKNKFNTRLYKGGEVYKYNYKYKIIYSYVQSTNLKKVYKSIINQKH